MARCRRHELSRARRGVAVRGGRRTVRSPVNGPVGESFAWTQHVGAHLGAASEIRGSTLVHSSGVEVQSGCLADGLDVHQPTCMGLQPSRMDLDVLPLAEFDPTQRLGGSDIYSSGAANLETVFPIQSGNQSSERIRASPFPSDGSLASVLSSGAGNPTSNALHAAPTAADDDFPTALCLGPEVMSPLPEILPLQEAERIHMLEQFFALGHHRSLEDVSSLSPPNQLYQPEHLEGPMQMWNYDPPSHSHTSRSLLPLGEMIHGLSATHTQSFPFGHLHQQSSQQTLTDLDEGLQRQLLGSAPFHSSRSNERCAMEDSDGYPRQALNSQVITDIFPNIVEAAPTILRADNAIVQFLDRANQIERSRDEIKVLEQKLKDSEQLVAALCDVNASINVRDTAAARLFTSSELSCMDYYLGTLELTAACLHLIHFATFQRN